MKFSVGVHEDSNMSDGIRKLKNHEKFARLDLKSNLQIKNADTYITANLRHPLLSAPRLAYFCTILIDLAF